jgi:hypothetical protein
MKKYSEKRLKYLRHFQEARTMTTDKATKLINSLIMGEIDSGITSSLVDHLRHGNANLIHQETWDKIACFLESGCKKATGRPPTGKSHKTQLRNQEIKQEYKRLLDHGIPCKQAWDVLAHDHNLSFKTIRGIVTHH